MASRCNAIRPLCILCSPTSDHFTSPTFRHPAKLPIRKHRWSAFSPAVTLLTHQLLLAPAAHRHGLFRLMSFSGQIIRPCPGTIRTDGGTVSGSLSGRQRYRRDRIKVVEDQRTRAVMDKFRAFVKKAQSYSSASITKKSLSPRRPKPQSSPAHRRLQSPVCNHMFQNPGRHSRGGGFAVCTGNASTQRSRSTKSCSHCGPDI